MIRTRTVITALTLVSVLALGACSGDDPEPKFGPTPSTSAPTSPSTTAGSGPTQPTMPVEADQLDRAGADIFIDYWFETLSHAIQSGDTTLAKAASELECVSCAGLTTKIEDLYGKGGRIESDGWNVEKAALDGEFQTDRSAFLLRVHEARQTLYEGERVVDRTPMMKVTMRITLSAATGHWLVNKLEIFQ